MSTPYSEIYELFQTGLKDPTLDRLFQKSIEDYENYLKPFLIIAISEFDFCKQDLEDRDDDECNFNITLGTKEKVILSKLMKIAWLEKEIHDINQMKLHLQDGDFKTYSEAQNLKAKQDLLIIETELIDKSIGRYDFKNYMDSLNG